MILREESLTKTLCVRLCRGHYTDTEGCIFCHTPWSSSLRDGEWLYNLRGSPRTIFPTLTKPPSLKSSYRVTHGCTEETSEVDTTSLTSKENKPTTELKSLAQHTFWFWNSWLCCESHRTNHEDDTPSPVVVVRTEDEGGPVYRWLGWRSLFRRGTNSPIDPERKCGVG